MLGVLHQDVEQCRSLDSTSCLRRSGDDGASGEMEAHPYAADPPDTASPLKGGTSASGEYRQLGAACRNPRPPRTLPPGQSRSPSPRELHLSSQTPKAGSQRRDRSRWTPRHHRRCHGRPSKCGPQAQSRHPGPPVRSAATLGTAACSRPSAYHSRSAAIARSAPCPTWRVETTCMMVALWGPPGKWPLRAGTPHYCKEHQRAFCHPSLCDDATTNSGVAGLGCSPTNSQSPASPRSASRAKSAPCAPQVLAGKELHRSSGEGAHTATATPCCADRQNGRDGQRRADHCWQCSTKSPDSCCLWT
mmetsp:Transcript_19671/g.55432  ORF Transcript_19671/g.55432 Transcript_19671/m.55432 type:complete len:304 (+) Transcript_19671:322-1233(+)